MRIRQVNAELECVNAELRAAEVELRRRESALVERHAQARSVFLPDGWSAALDPESGAQYYFNEGTGEISWERPGNRVAAMELPPGWVAVSDPSTASTYYHHEVTGEVTWERPNAEHLPPAEANIPLWKAIGVPEARVSGRAADLERLEEAIAANDFQTAIEVRNKLQAWSEARGLRSQRL